MNRAVAHLLALAFASGALADIEEYLERDWYFVETLFFRHAVSPGDEDFTRQGTPHHRLAQAALEPAPPEYLERIAARPPEPLDFPRLEQFDCIAPIPAPWMEDDVELIPEPKIVEEQEDEAHDQPPQVSIPTLPAPWIENDVDSTPEPGIMEEQEDEAHDQPSQVSIQPIPMGPPAPSPEQRARWALEEFEGGLMREGWQWQYDDLSLRTTASRMRRSGDYEILHHGKWLQAVPPRDSAAPLLIQLGAPMRDATFELEGSVSVTLGRFLHFATEVWLRNAPPDREAAVALGDVADAAGDARSSIVDDARYVLLSESRRMRPGELHYLDHPWLGILVRIEPVEAPDALLARLESLPDGLPAAGSD